MKRITLAVLAALSLAAAPAAFAGNSNTYTSSAGYGSSVDISGGSMAESGQYGNGTSSQYSNSSGYGIAVGATGIGGGYTGGGNFNGGFGAAGAGSVSGVYGTSGTYSYSSGSTTGNGYGDSKGGAGVDYSSYGYSNFNGSYSY